MLGIAKLKVYGKDVIGIDEHNNGFQKKGIPLVIAGYFMPHYYNAHKGNEPYERKGLAFSDNPNHKSNFVRRAKEFLRRNPCFCYTLLEEKVSKKLYMHGRASAIASITAKIIEKYNVNQSNLVILLHRIDEPACTRAVGEALEDLLEKAEIKAHFIFKPDEDCNRTLKKADRVAYYLGGLKFNCPERGWPFRNKMVHFKFIDDYTNRLGDSIYDIFEKA